MSVDESELRKLADLARLGLGEDEARRLARDLDRLLGWLQQVRDVGIDADAQASETVHAGERAMPLRPDVARPGLPRDVLTAGAPSAPAGLFEVPKVLGGGEDPDDGDSP